MSRNASIAGKTFNLINYLSVTIFMLLCFYPFYYLFIYSLSSGEEALREGVYLLPRGFNFFNYIQILKLQNIYSSFGISLARTVVGTTLTLFCCSFFAYLVTKKELPLRKAIYRYVILTMYLYAGLIPWYITMKMLGLQNNFLLYVLPGAMNAFFVILIKTFIESLPPALEESAMMDGAGYMRTYINLILPLIKPILATVTLYCAVGQWNAWTDNYFLVREKSLQTLQMILYDYLRQSESMSMQAMTNNNPGSLATIQQFKITPFTIRMTITMVITLPIILVYPFLQRYFVKGLMLGAVKG